jgi:hypothetical protein
MKKKILLLPCLFLIYITLTGIGTTNANGSFITVVAPSTNPEPGQLFRVNITITNSPLITQWIIRNVTWDPAYMELETNTTASFVKGTFLEPYGSTVWLTKKPNNVSGIAPELSCAYLDGGPCPGGDGLLCQIRFRAKAVGSSEIRIAVAWLLDGMNMQPDPARVNSTIIVIPEFPTSMVIPVFLITTTVALIAATVLHRKRRPIKIP